ncbi:hypothetical protein E4U42_006375 [Claviceps africana]|uniref:Uncharacterized protein n=1 Tax=Claviceps africana TaxID=83212 RepID=A0A8K0J5A8_9HYPO|nr:hypothetical protein E4U42_006375 [Claviceps africana]
MHFSTAALAAVAILAGQTLAACSREIPKRLWESAADEVFHCGDATVVSEDDFFTLHTGATPMAIKIGCGSDSAVFSTTTLYCDANSSDEVDAGAGMCDTSLEYLVHV